MSPLEAVAQAIRREVRLSAGIAEGQEFRCDWDRVAAAVLADLELREEWGNTWAGQGPAINRSRAEAEQALTYAMQQFPDADYPHQVVRRLVSGWQPIGEEQP